MNTMPAEDETLADTAPAKHSFRDDAPDEDFTDYRVMNRLAVVAVGLAVMGLLGLISPSLLAIAIAGVVCAVIAIRTIANNPTEYSGMPVAVLALVANLALSIGGAYSYWYEYKTEKKDGYDRVGFYEIQSPLGEVTMFPDKVKEIDKSKIFIKGYMHPSVASLGRVKEFVLVPDMGTCCFGGQPKVTDMILVSTDEANATAYRTRMLKLHGVFRFNPGEVRNFAKDCENVVYQLNADQVR